MDLGPVPGAVFGDLSYVFPLLKGLASGRSAGLRQLHVTHQFIPTDPHVLDRYSTLEEMLSIPRPVFCVFIEKTSSSKVKMWDSVFSSLGLKF